MKLRVVIDVDVSTTIAETMQRNGFAVCVDGSALQIKVTNCPAIPKRKTKIKFIESPQESVEGVANKQEIKEVGSNNIPTESPIVRD